jgi:TonB family protein
MLVVRALYLSLIIHAILYIGITQFPAQFIEKPMPKISTTEVEVIDKPFKDDKTKKQFVREAQAPDKMTFEDDTEARFLSKERQRVILESRARDTGITHNADPNKPNLAKMEQQTQPKPQKRDLSGYEPAPIRLPRPNEVMPEGPSTVGETLPTDVAIGNFTALNTDRFQFYTFFARIEELVRFRWESQIKNALTAYDDKYVQTNISRKNWITHVEFLISPDGHLKESRIMKMSGIKGFDAAAVWAFQDARYFPNPPQELVEGDGYIHLKYAFNVYFESAAVATR